MEKIQVERGSLNFFHAESSTIFSNHASTRTRISTAEVCIVAGVSHAGTAVSHARTATANTRTVTSLIAVVSARMRTFEPDATAH